MKRVRQIIAIGGAGFTAEPENPRQELYLLAQTRKPNPSVCFIGTATGDAATYVAKFYAAFSRHRCRLTHLPFFERTPDLRKLLVAQDLVYVGGNTKSMLAVWRDWQLPKILREAWNRGTVLSGTSAGAICWFETGSRIPGQGTWHRWHAWDGCRARAARTTMEKRSGVRPCTTS